MACSVAKTTQPNDVQGLLIIRMMHLWLASLTAGIAELRTNKFASSKCISGNAMCHALYTITLGSLIKHPLSYIPTIIFLPASVPLVFPLRVFTPLSSRIFTLIFLDFALFSLLIIRNTFQYLLTMLPIILSVFQSFFLFIHRNIVTQIQFYFSL